jgi:hypothetical protein
MKGPPGGRLLGLRHSCGRTPMPAATLPFTQQFTWYVCPLPLCCAVQTCEYILMSGQAFSLASRVLMQPYAHVHFAGRPANAVALEISRGVVY